MTEEAFLSGKVRKQSLPVFVKPPGPGGPEMKRLILPQGDLAQIWSADEGIRYIAWMEFREGSVRGNHYHHKKQEWIYILDGEIELIVEDPTSEVREVLLLVPGDLVVIEPEVPHALRTVLPGQGIEFSPARFDLTDVERYPLVD